MEDMLLKNFVTEISKKFPEASSKTEYWLKERGLNAFDNLYAWLESFADRTNDLVKERDEKGVREHLNFFEAKLEMNDEEITRFIDVSYVENLLWDSSDDDKRWAWRLFPKKVKELYIDMWGETSL